MIKFLDTTTTLWRGPGSLRGTPAYYPLDLELPTHCTGPFGAWRLPSTFLERNARASVVYDLIVCFARGMFHANSL